MQRASPTALSGFGAHKLRCREQQVLQLIAEGKTSRQAACELGIALKTASNYRQRVMSKLDVHNTDDLVGAATGLGVLKSAFESATCLTYRGLVHSIKVHLLRISQYSLAAGRAVGAANETGTDELQRQIAAALVDAERAIGALNQHRCDHGC
jgi:DNA-binding CsgD family transcriptional regulator